MTANRLWPLGPGRIALGLALLAFALYASRLALNEFRYEALGTPSISTIEGLVTGPGVDLPRSDRAAQTVLDGCYRLLVSTYFKASTSNRSSAALVGCRTEGEAVAQRVPTNGLALLVVATADAVGGQPEFGRALEASRSASPNVSWLAIRRVALAVDHADLLAATGPDTLALDLRTLASTEDGAQALAKLFRLVPTSQAKITAAMQSSSPAAQARFLQLVKGGAP